MANEERREHRHPTIESDDVETGHEAEPVSPERDEAANPPNTTEHGITAPKFGSAGSGGAEYEPAPGT